MLLGESRITNKLDYVDLIISYLNERRVRGVERAYMVIHI